MRPVVFDSVLASIGAVLIVAAWPRAADNLPEITLEAVMSDRSGPKLAQSAYGYRCQTQIGICPIEPAPLGAPCRCGTYQGFVIP